jgi:hypothetical protein
MDCPGQLFDQSHLYLIAGQLKLFILNEHNIIDCELGQLGQLDPKWVQYFIGV